MPGEYDSITKIQYNTILPNFNTESRPSEIFIFSVHAGPRKAAGDVGPCGADRNGGPGHGLGVGPYRSGRSVGASLPPSQRVLGVSRRVSRNRREGRLASPSGGGVVRRSPARRMTEGVVRLVSARIGGRIVMRPYGGDGTAAWVPRSADHWSANLSRDEAPPSNARRYGRRPGVNANRREGASPSPTARDGASARDGGPPRVLPPAGGLQPRAAGGRRSEGAISAAVEKTEEQRSPNGFSGTARRTGGVCRSPARQTTDEGVCGTKKQETRFPASPFTEI